MTPIPTLHTERLTLRAWDAKDGPEFAVLSADAELMRFMGGPMDTCDAWRRMATYAGHWLLRGYGPWALQDKASGGLVGYCGIYDPDSWPEREISWGVARPFLGKGYMTEAARRVRSYAYGTLGWPTIASCIDMENASSIRVAERLGAKLEKVVDWRGRPRGVFRHLPPSAVS